MKHLLCFDLVNVAVEYISCDLKGLGFSFYMRVYVRNECRPDGINAVACGLTLSTAPAFEEEITKNCDAI
jgi:hypothetical protein